MATKANYVIKEAPFDPSEPVVIVDQGPWDKFQSVTNAAEWVVERLVQRGDLRPGQRLLYYDSDGVLDEIVVKDGKFAGFKPGPQRDLEKRKEF